MKDQTSPNVALIPLDQAGRPLVTTGMKAKCIGEISFDIELHGECPKCGIDNESADIDDDGNINPEHECEICNGDGTYNQKETLDWPLMKKAYSLMAEAAIAEKPQYSLDHDALGIRALVVDTITGVLFLGNCEAERPPAGHWLEPIYEMGAATAAQSSEIECLRGVCASLTEENNRMRRGIDKPEPRTEAQVISDCNALARNFYAKHGCTVDGDFKFYKAHHPLEKLCWYMAVLAYEEISGTDVEGALADIEDSDHQGAAI